MRLARGAGLDGLSAMAETFEHRGIRFHRPVLGWSRAALREVLRARDIGWIEDPTNVDDRFLRTRARQALAHLAPLDITPERIADAAQRLRGARAGLEALTQSFLHAVVTRDPLGCYHLDGAGFAQAPYEVQSRALTALLREIGGEPYPPRREALDRVLRALDAGRETLTLGGAILQPSPAGPMICREPGALGAQSCAYAPSGTVWDNRWLVEGEAPEGCRVGHLAEDEIPARLGRESPASRRVLASTPVLFHDGRVFAAPCLEPHPTVSATLLPSALLHATR